MKPSSAVKQLSDHNLYQLSVSSQFHFIKIYKYYYYGLFTADQCYENLAKLKQLSLYNFFFAFWRKNLFGMRKKQFTLKNFFFVGFLLLFCTIISGIVEPTSCWVFFKLKYGIIQEGCIFCQQNVCMRLNDTQWTVHRG